jgi:hypothetical protein
LRIHVEIDQLVLHGFNNKHDIEHIDQDIENELARLLIAKDGIEKNNNKVTKSRDGEIINRIDGGSFNFGSAHSISKLAAASIANSIHQAMGTTQSARNMR